MLRVENARIELVASVALPISNPDFIDFDGASCAILTAKDDRAALSWCDKSRVPVPFDTRGVTFIDRGRALLILWRNQLQRWDITGSSPRLAWSRDVPTTEGSSRLFAADSSGAHVVLGAEDHASILDLTGDQLVRTGVVRHLSSLSKVRFSSDGKRVVLRDRDHLACWHVEDTKPLLMIPIDSEVWAFSPDGDRIAALGEEGLAVYDVGLPALLERACDTAIERRLWQPGQPPCGIAGRP